MKCKKEPAKRSENEGFGEGILSKKIYIIEGRKVYYLKKKRCKEMERLKMKGRTETELYT